MRLFVRYDSSQNESESYNSNRDEQESSGVIASMNRYLGIPQVTTASHNPRLNAVVEHFVQHLM
jgi:hypothetical protein